MAADLDARIAKLSDKIRRYPTPIARCDEQLTELLERRARLLAEKEGENRGQTTFSVPTIGSLSSERCRKTWSVPDFPSAWTGRGPRTTSHVQSVFGESNVPQPA